MKIADAVRQAVAAGHDEWELCLPPSERSPHIANWQLEARPDGADAHIFRQLMHGWPSHRARMTHVERRDGTLMPWLIFMPWDLDRRAHLRQGRTA
jgi:hypothetical protein